MAWRFPDLVVDSEIDNTVRGRVTGWVRLTGRSEPSALDLHGDCHPDLRSYLDQQTRDIDRAIRDSLDEPPTDIDEP